MQCSSAEELQCYFCRKRVFVGAERFLSSHVQPISIASLACNTSRRETNATLLFQDFVLASEGIRSPVRHNISKIKRNECNLDFSLSSRDAPLGRRKASLVWDRYTPRDKGGREGGLRHMSLTEPAAYIWW